MIDGGHTKWKLSAWIQNDISKHFITLQPFICHVHKHKWMYWLHYGHLGCRGGMALLNKICPMNTALKYIKTDFFFFPYIYLLRILFCFFFFLLILCFLRVWKLLFSVSHVAVPILWALPRAFFLLANTNFICNENIATLTALPTSILIVFHQTIMKKSKFHLFHCLLS